MAAKLQSLVELIPWDFTSPEHLDRMHEQRVACGWAADDIASFVEFSQKGDMVYYWAVRPGNASSSVTNELIGADHRGHGPRQGIAPTETL